MQKSAKLNFDYSIRNVQKLAYEFVIYLKKIGTKRENFLQKDQHLIKMYLKIVENISLIKILGLSTQNKNMVLKYINT